MNTPSSPQSTAPAPIRHRKRGRDGGAFEARPCQSAPLFVGRAGGLAAGLAASAPAWAWAARRRSPEPRRRRRRRRLRLQARGFGRQLRGRRQRFRRREKFRISTSWLAAASASSATRQPPASSHHGADRQARRQQSAIAGTDHLVARMQVSRLGASMSRIGLRGVVAGHHRLDVAAAARW